MRCGFGKWSAIGVVSCVAAACHGSPKVVDGPDASSGGATGGTAAVGGASLGGSDSGGASGSGGTTGGSGGSSGSGAEDGGIEAGDAAADASDGAADGDAGDVGCGQAPSIGASCAGLAKDCGPAKNESCCETRCVPGGTFQLGRDQCDPDDKVCTATNRVCATGTDKVACQANQSPAVTATIRAVWLDRFEVTVGRFRNFVAALIGGWKPAAGSGKHGYLNGGVEPGWDASWTLFATKSEWDSWLQCNPADQTWTPNPGPNENRPANCMGWRAAYAFCIWDGGFLPTEAEWERAASGGEERVFPWSSPASDTSVDQSKVCWSTGCAGIGVVGSTPAGDGRWGHADLSGNVGEWTLDRFVNSFPTDPCVDCFVTGSGYGTVATTVRGSWYGGAPHQFPAAWRYSRPHHGHFPHEGLRCARAVK